MTQHNHIEAHWTATGHPRQPAWPRRRAITEIGSSMPKNSLKALNRNTHTLWDNPGCLALQPSIKVSGIEPVDWLDKDT